MPSPFSSQLPISGSSSPRRSCAGGKLCQQLCVPTQASSEPSSWGHFQKEGCVDWNPWNLKNAQNSCDWSNCNKCTNHSLHFKESGHQRTCGTVYNQLMFLAKLHRGTTAFSSFSETLWSLYKHNHLPADQTAGMTPMALSLGKNHAQLVRFVIFTELFSLRHSNGHHPWGHTSILVWSKSAFLKLISLCPCTIPYFSLCSFTRAYLLSNNIKIKDAVHLPVVIQSIGLQYHWHKVKALRTHRTVSTGSSVPAAFFCHLPLLCHSTC